MDARDYIEANRQSWDEAAPIHAKQKLAELIEGFRQPGYSCLDVVETAILEKIGVRGRAVAQLCCNNGREILSVKNMGAARAVGFDQAEKFLDQGRQMAAAGAIDCELVACNVFEIPATFDGQFDLVTVTIGVFGWMPDLAGFFRVAARLLRPGGRMFVYEQHPVIDMFDPEDKSEPAQLRFSYFDPGPFPSNSGLDYWSRESYDSKTNYWFHHKLSDIFKAFMEIGFVLESFEEYAHDISVYPEVERLAARPPMSMSLVLRKGA